jgi:hypothetical protein
LQPANAIKASIFCLVGMANRILSVAFKAYQQHQGMLLPPSLDELISQGRPVRIVNQVMDKINIDPLLK